MKKKSTIIIIVVIVVIILLFSWVKGTYNGLVSKEEAVNSQWAQVENVYQRRSDLIPNLVATVKGYAEHEQEVLTDVVEARAKATSINLNADNMTPENMQVFQNAQEQLSGALSRLLLTVEKYPDLKANQNFLELQAQLEGTENRITVERQKFNNTAKEYNQSIRHFPANIFANMFGFENNMSPDDHYCDLKRVIAACGGKAKSITVVMPSLYGGRQHRRNARESLDCAQMLQELTDMGVSEIITFDAHDPRVQNAVPLMGFDNFLPTYQILKAMLRSYTDLDMTRERFMIVSPDEGAMSRNIYYASVLGTDLGMFYKRRDYANVVNGRNPIVAHEYIGNDVRNKDIFVADDIIATGDSMLKLCNELKERGCGKIFLSATYALFTEGLKKFDDAYEQGLFTAVISTNLTYAPKELLERKWFIQADMSKFLAYIISACDQNKSLSELLDPHDKIHELIAKFNANKPEQIALDIEE